ncbi:MAG: hypothetical protein Q8941_14850 [Bacteroidota bacterium]|nr:hypothetical protein [Bacteroidota bacterium]
MRKLYLVLSFISLVSFSADSQSPVYKIVHSYFRSDPFQTEFSAFLTHLLNDPTLTEKILNKRTDSSLFYFQGTYTNHNPFFFKPTKVKVVLTETPVLVDSLHHPDTIFTYQLFAYDNDSKEGVHELKKEFEKICHRYKGDFPKNTYSETREGTELKGETYNFFDSFHAVAPFAVAWLGPNEDKEICLVIVIRMGLSNNKAELPVSFYTP